MDLIAQHTVGVIKVSFLPFRPLVVREKRSSQYPCQLFIERRGGAGLGGSREGEIWGEAVEPACWRRTEDPPRMACPKSPYPPIPPLGETEGR